MRNLLSAVVLAGAVSAAQADTVNLDYVGKGKGRDITVALTGYNGGNSFGLFAGQLKHTFSAGTGNASMLNGQTLVTFCTEITQTVYNQSSPSSTQYTVMPIRNLPTPGSGMGAAKEQAIWDLFRYADSTQILPTANDDYAAAFQMTIWEIVYDGPGSMSLTGGSIQFTNVPAQTATFFTAFKNNALDGLGTGRGLIGVGNPTYQDQIILVPLPQGTWLAAAGLGLAGLVRLRRRA